MPTPDSTPNLTPDLTLDLTKLDGSDLRKLAQSDAQTLLTLGQSAAGFFGKPVQAAADKLAATFSLSAPGSWKTGAGIGFSLKASAACKLAVAAKSSGFPVAKAIDSTATQEIHGQPPAGSVYVNIEMDFDIQGNLSGSGSASGIGIAGKASGTGAATFAYCHPVAEETETWAAIRAAFQAMKFPFQPDSAIAMPVGAIANVKFNATFGLELDLSYGLGTYTVAAPGLSAIQTSLKLGAESFTPPSLSAEAGLKASFGYRHSESYEAIVSRTSATRAMLLLSRSASGETDESLGVTAGVTLAGTPSATADAGQLAKAINGVTGFGGDQAAGALNDLQAALVAKSSSWLTEKSVGNASLTATLTQQRSRALLYEFSADLANPGIAEHSWSSFAKGDLETAMRAGGLTLLPGSGVAECLKRSTAIQLQFFNLFAVTDTKTYFRNTYVEVASDGALRYRFDIGEETKDQIRKALEQTSLHFAASAADQGGAPETVEVDLNLELTETGRPRASDRIVDALSRLATVRQQAQLKQFLHDTPKGTLSVQAQCCPTAYGKIGSQPDAANWKVFQGEAVRLMGLGFASGLSYADWALFNRLSIDGLDPLSGQPRRAAPDRRQSGDPAAVPPSFYAERNLADAAEAVRYFLQASAQFMNLCADLASLADESLSLPDTKQSWDELIANVERLVASDTSTDWSVPAASALLALCGGSAVASSLQLQKSKAVYTVKVA
jgi:hypothetical protein